jgi:multidrug resistance efflux pump
MSTTTISEQNVVPEETAEPVSPRTRAPWLRKALRMARTVIAVLILLGAALWGGNHIVRERIADRAFVDAGTAVLTAQPIVVGSADAGVVTQAQVIEGSTVTAGAVLAKVTLTADGGGVPRVQELRAPGAGVVTDVLAPGQVARAGEPVVTLYDPAKLEFQVEIPLETLRRLRLGMTAYVSGPGLAGRVTTTLEKVQARVETPAGAPGRLTVVLRPAPDALATVRTLVPGLQFAVVVDTTTAPGRTPAVNCA